MKLATPLGILCAIVLHVGVLLFGGFFFLGDDDDKGTLQEVELLSDEDTAPEKKEEPAVEKDAEEMETEVEEPPDAAEIIRNLELSAMADAPALDAASLSAIEQALSGLAGSGDFAEALSFSSGGRIGGLGKPGELGGVLENAFNLTEIDQQPRAIVQGMPMYPAAMRGKKVEAVVSVVFVVDPAGKVAEPRVEKSTHPAFDKPALDAVKQWKFEPAIKAGQRVPCKMRVPIRFQQSQGS